MAEQSDVRSNKREPDETQSERQTEFSETQMHEEPNEGGATMEVQEEEEEKKEKSDDFDEIVLDLGFSEPAEPPPPPPEGTGLQFQHKHQSLTLRHLLTVTTNKVHAFNPVFFFLF